MEYVESNNDYFFHVSLKTHTKDFLAILKFGALPSML